MAPTPRPPRPDPATLPVELNTLVSPEVLFELAYPFFLDEAAFAVLVEEAEQIVAKLLKRRKTKIRED